MSATAVRGQVYVCPLCGAEVSVIAAGPGDFDPHCCNVAMTLIPGKILTFYRCPLCGAEVALINGVEQHLDLHCCSVNMVKLPQAA